MKSVNRSKPRLFAALVAGSAAAMMLAGCSSGAGALDSAGASDGVSAPAGAPISIPSIGAMPTIAATADRALPLDSYLLTKDQHQLIRKAEYTAQAACMSGFGFSIPPMPNIPAPNYGADSDLRMSGHYGSQSLSFAKQWGYHPEGGLGALPGGSATSSAAGQSEPTADWQTAMTGASPGSGAGTPGGQTINGQVVPVNGCLGEAKKALSGTSDLQSVGDPSTAQNILDETLARSIADPRVVAVFAKWSACMSNSGFHYETPLTVKTDKRWRATDLPTQAEINTAVADQQCRAQENVVGVWYAVDSAYETQAINVQAEKMAEVKQSIQVQLKNAAKVLAGE